MQRSTVRDSGKNGSVPEPIAFEQDLTEEEFYEDEMSDDEVPSAREEQALKGKRIDVESIVALTVRLAQILAQEADLLAEMKIKDIEKLQKEKTSLLDALESQKRFIDRNPELIKQMTDEECLELAQIIEIFQTVMRENYRRLLIAKEVNMKVVEAISSVVKDATKNGFYDEAGRPELSTQTVSMAVDKRI